MTNVDLHTQIYGGGRYQKSSINRRCDRYFGSLVRCRGLIRPGEEFFNTEEPISDHRSGSFFITCRACANAVPNKIPERRCA